MKIFFSGIGGSGMSAIAGFMANQGHAIAGSDRAFDSNSGNIVRKTLESGGITIYPQDGSGIDSSFDFVVFSTAVETDQPEFRKAESAGIPIKFRPEYLADITSQYKTIAVSGTSGKSTTSGLLAFLMDRLGLGPNYIGGGRVRQFMKRSGAGNYLTGGSNYLIIEACESDGSIINYHPWCSIILNLALDHHSIAETAGMFRQLIRNTSGKVILNADDANLSGMPRGKEVTFSIHRPSDYCVKAVRSGALSTDFMLNGTQFSLPLPGEHNLYNAVACITFLAEAGISLPAIASELPEFQGIERRFSVILSDGKNLVIDDYAHNPHKISSLMKTAASIRDRICYVFQPHGFQPTRMMMKEYIETFIERLRPSDRLILLPIYYAGGTVSRDISSNMLADAIRAAGKHAEVQEKRSDILIDLDNNYAYIILGARDDSLADFAGEIASSLKGNT